MFEEQISGDGALSTPDMRPYNGGPDDYLAHLENCSGRFGIPIIASINGYSDGPSLDFAVKLEKAGASAIEFNAYSLAGYPIRSAQDVEERLCRSVGKLCSKVKVPVAVKLHPFYSSLPHLAARLSKEGAKGVILFNRFYYPDIDTQKMLRHPVLLLSERSELLLRLRWTSILSGWFPGDIAITGGVHASEDIVKSLLVGAKAVQCASSKTASAICPCSDPASNNGCARTNAPRSKISSAAPNTPNATCANSNPNAPAT